MRQRVESHGRDGGFPDGFGRPIRVRAGVRRTRIVPDIDKHAFRGR